MKHADETNVFFNIGVSASYASIKIMPNFDHGHLNSSQTLRLYFSLIKLKSKELNRKNWKHFSLKMKEKKTNTSY